MRRRAEHLPSTAQMPARAKSIQRRIPRREDPDCSLVSALPGSLRSRKIIYFHISFILLLGDSSPFTTAVDEHARARHP